MQVSRLLFVASVDESHKLICQAPGCGRAIAKAVHVIRDETGAVHVVGSGCFMRLAGHELASRDGAAFSGFDGRRLSAEERALMAADTVAFVASVEARLAGERRNAEAQQGLELAERSPPDSESPAVPPQLPHRPSRNEWRTVLGDGPEFIRPGDRAAARDQLAQYRAQQARMAARIAMQRRPELATHPLDVVADAMAHAKERCLARGLRMDAPNARATIEMEATVILAGRAPSPGR